MKILCHVGPWCVQQYSEIARNVEFDAEIVLISHFLELDETGMSKSYYKNLKMPSQDDNSDLLDADDFIKRCRLLRSLNKEDALLHLYSMKKAVSDAFDSEKPDLVISEVIDQYLIDLIKFECDKREVPFFGLVVSFVNGYFRITSRGERSIERHVNMFEVKKAIKEMEEITYIPNFVSQSSTRFKNIISISKRIILNWARLPYFFIKRTFSGQKYNYHYWASQISAYNNFHILPAFRLGNKRWKDEVKATNKTIIYHPLQMYPEATIEYWCECLKDIDYDDKLIRIIKSMDANFHFLIKEHPNVIGVRSTRLYKSLSSLSNVTIVPTEYSSNDVSKQSHAILVWTGSAGFEAALRGKPVLTICEPYYVFGDKFKKINENMPNHEVLEHIELNSNKLSYDNKISLVTNLLSGLRPGKYINDASWSPLNPEHMTQAKEIGQEIKKDLSRAP
jgi:hypothetical protein